MEQCAFSLLGDNSIAYTTFDTRDLSSFNFKQQDEQIIKDKQDCLLVACYRI